MVPATLGPLAIFFFSEGISHRSFDFYCKKPAKIRGLVHVPSLSISNPDDARQELAVYQWSRFSRLHCPEAMAQAMAQI